VVVPPTAATPPATRCSSATEQATPPANDAIGRELAELAASTADAFVARRSKLVARGKGAQKRLRELGTAAPTARERALALALVTRIERPADAKQLDAWTPPASAMKLRNPFPAVSRALEEAYSPFPELAFGPGPRPRRKTRPFLRDARKHRSVATLGVVAKGPEAYERLADLAPRFLERLRCWWPRRRAGTCAALNWLDGKLPESATSAAAPCLERWRATTRSRLPPAPGAARGLAGLCRRPAAPRAPQGCERSADLPPQLADKTKSAARTQRRRSSAQARPSGGSPS
jgi:hypothetical protein